MTEERPLAGRTVLVTRPEDRGRELVSRLQSLGARATLHPTIAVGPPSDPEPARAAVERLDGYDLIVFTSARGVQFFLENLRASGEGARSRLRASIAAIGPATAAALREAGLAQDIVAQDSRAEGLADLLKEERVSGHQVLLVQPESARDLLPQALRNARARVDAVPFYRTAAAPGVGEVAEEIARGRFDAIVFTSPSTFHCLLGAAGASRDALVWGLRRSARIAIGPFTAAALESADLPATAVASSPSNHGIIDALLRVLGRPPKSAVHVEE